MKKQQPNPQIVEPLSTHDLNVRVAAFTLCLATIVLLGALAVRGPEPGVVGLLAITLSSESLTLVSHARSKASRRRPPAL